MIDPLERWRELGLPDKPDYAGLLTYAGMPYTQDPAELAGVDIAVIGAPTDDLVSDRPGTRLGPRAIRAVGDWVRARNAKVTTFYVSNVEQYLFQQGDEAQRFYENVATLPIDSTSTFVRSFAGGRFLSADTLLMLKPQSPNGRSLQLTSSIAETLRAHREGRLVSWTAVIGVSHQ